SRLPSRKRKEISVDTVQDEDPRAIQKKKMTMTVGVIIIILLIVSISFGAYQKNTKEKISLYKPRLTEAQHNFDESLNLLTLSPERARDHFLKSRELVDALVGEGVVDEELAALDTNLKENQGRVLGEYENEAQSFIDLSLL